MGRKLTTAEYKERVYELVQDEYEVLSEYEGNRIPLQMKHQCGHIYDVMPVDFLRGRRCPNCTRVGRRKKPAEQFKQELQAVLGEEYTILGEYQGTKELVLIQHNTCGTKFESIPYHLLKGRKCPTCHPVGRQKKTTEQFKADVYALVGEEYEVVGTYNGAAEKVEMQHVTCGTTYLVRANSFLNGQRCCACKNGVAVPNRERGKRGRAKKTTAKFKEELFGLVGDEYQLNSEYEGSIAPIELTHKCGYTFQTRPTDFLKGRRCPVCTAKIKQRQKVLKALENETLTNPLQEEIVTQPQETVVEISHAKTKPTETMAVSSETESQHAQKGQPMNRFKAMVQKLKSKFGR